MKPTITIEYCPKCNWMLRAAYMAQELLSTFADEVYGVTLQPSETSGKYNIRIMKLWYLTVKSRAAFLRSKN